MDVFAHATLNSLPPGPPCYHGVGLNVWAGNKPVVGLVARPKVMTHTVTGQAYPRWVFNDVPVRPGMPYTFIASALEAGGKYPSDHVSVWVHAADARSILPNPQPPLPCTL